MRLLSIADETRSVLNPNRDSVPNPEGVTDGTPTVSVPDNLHAVSSGTLASIFIHDTRLFFRVLGLRTLTVAGGLSA